MDYVTSKDGTSIAFDRLGDGPPGHPDQRRIGRPDVERASAPALIEFFAG